MKVAVFRDKQTDGVELRIPNSIADGSGQFEEFLGYIDLPIEPLKFGNKGFTEHKMQALKLGEAIPLTPESIQQGSSQVNFLKAEIGKYKLTCKLDLEEISSLKKQVEELKKENEWLTAIRDGLYGASLYWEKRGKQAEMVIQPGTKVIMLNKTVFTPLIELFTNLPIGAKNARIVYEE